MREDA